MDHRRKATTALLAATLTLGLAATALAAHPNSGARYVGTETNVSTIEGFSAPVSFKLAADGSRLEHFTYGTIGCFGAGGFRPGVNPYTASDLISVGPIPVTSSGSFSISSSKSTFHSAKYGYTYTTTSHVTGRFTSGKSATGSITFSQTDKPKTGKAATCKLTVPRLFKVSLKG